MNFSSSVFLTIALSSVLSGCGFNSDQTDNSSSLNNIFGTDDRELASSSVMTYQAIGRTDSGCTAFLVAPQLAVTAAHCIVESSTGAVKSVIGSFNTDYGSDKKPKVSAQITNAWVGSFNPEEFRTKDWAIIELAKPIGNDLGYFTLEEVDFSKEALPFETAAAGYQMGFEEGNKAGVDKDCQIRQIDDKGRLLNDCDSSGGISGGPLFRGSLPTQNAVEKVVAIAVSEFRSGATSTVRRDEYEEGYANVGVPLLELIPALKEVTQKRDAGSPRGDVQNAFYLNVASSTPAVPQKHIIQLRAASSWSGGTFRDNVGKIRCSSPSGECKGTYDSGTSVTLTAPSTIVAFGRTGVFQYWLCSDARENFPGTNVCAQNGRECAVQMSSDLICSAWYQ